MYKKRTLESLVNDVFIISKNEGWDICGKKCTTKRRLRTLVDAFDIRSTEDRGFINGLKKTDKIECITMSENPEYFL